MAESPNIGIDQSVRRKQYSSLSQFDIKHDTASKRTEHKKSEQNALKKRQTSSPLELYGPGGEVRSEKPVTRGINIDIVI